MKCQVNIVFLGLIKEKTTFQYIGGNNGTQIFGPKTIVSKTRSFNIQIYVSLYNHFHTKKCGIKNIHKYNGF